MTAHGNGRNGILVVEDDAGVASIISRHISSYGYPVVASVATGEEAVSIAAQSIPAIVLMDIGLQGSMDGIAAAKQIRTLGIPVIFVTGGADPSTLERSKEAEPFGYILKPINPSELHAAIETTLHRFKEERRRSLKTLEELSESRELLRVVMDHIPQRVFWKNLQLKFLGCNKPFAEDAGFRSPDELAGKAILDTVWAGQADCLERQERSVMEEDRPRLNCEEYWLGREGRRIWMQTNLIPFHDTMGRVAGVLGTYEDISDRKRGQEAARRSEMRLSALLKLSQMTGASEKEIVEYALEQALRITRSSVGYLRFVHIQEGLPPLVWSVPDPAPGETLKSSEGDCHWNAASEARSILAERVGNACSPGEEAPIQADLEIPIVNGERIVARLGVGRREDSYERVDERELSLLINGMWAQLQRKYAERERAEMEVHLRHALKLEAVGQLAAGIAHEINTPSQYIGDNTRFLQEAFRDLSVILRNHDRLLRACREGALTADLLDEVEASAREIDLDYLKEEIPRAINQSLEGILRVTTIVKAMKEFSHPGGDEKQAIDLNQAIESTLTVSRNEWKYVAEVKTDFDPHLQLVPCVPGEFNQVILNLIVNAAHAIADVVGKEPKGKGTISVCTRRDGEWAIVQVSDTGIGIPENIREKIFEPFFTTKEVGKGTGQGLAIARSVVVGKHSGSISFESQVGKGTTFTVKLPLVVASS